MSRQKDKPPRIDKRKIPELFRAVEKDDRPRAYYGELISDDGRNFVSISCRDDDESHLKERILSKSDFIFTRIDKTVYERFARPCVARMKREAEDHKLNYEAAIYNAQHAEELMKAITG